MPDNRSAVATPPDEVRSGEDRPAPARDARGRGRGHRLVLGAAPVVVYALLGVLSNLPVWLHGAGHVLQCGGCGDVGQEVWFLAWQPHALAHGHSGLTTSSINYPFGVNVMDNTSMPVAGFLGWPVTALFGPIATYNVLFSFAFFSSATAAFFVARRWIASSLACFVVGLMYGFSPYMIGEGRGHLFLLLVPLLPVMLGCLDELFLRQSRGAWPVGALLGLLASVQLGLSSELLAWAVVLGVCGTVILAVSKPSRLTTKGPHAAKGLLCAVVVFGALCSYPLWTQLAGPDHITGPIHPPSVDASLASDPLSLVVPTSNELISAGYAGRGDAFVGVTPAAPPHHLVAEPAENGSYVGIPLLLGLLTGLVLTRRRRKVWFAVAMAVIAFVISLGGYLHLDGRDTGVPLPFLLLEKLPLLENGIASRLSVFMWLFLALAAGLMIDGVLAPGRAGRTSGRRLTVGAIALVALVPLLPSWPYVMERVRVPSYFASPAERAVPRGSVLLTYPMSTAAHVAPMVWQALDHFSYKIPAGEASVETRNETEIESLFSRCYLGLVFVRESHEMRQRIRSDLALYKVGTIVMPLGERHVSCASAYVAEALDSAPKRGAGVLVWSSVQRKLGGTRRVRGG